jgi:hypothetical protein
MSDLPHEWDLDSLEAESLSTPGPEFIQKPTKEQYAEAVRNGLVRSIQKTLDEMNEQSLRASQLSAERFQTMNHALDAIVELASYELPPVEAGWLQKRQAG